MSEPVNEPSRRLPTGEIIVVDEGNGVYLIPNTDSEPSLDNARSLASQGEAVFLDRAALETISEHFADISILGA
jgi:hypothetical protein